MKTLADLKRDAKSGNLFAEMIIRWGSTEIPELQKGKRKIVGANTVGIFILRNDGKPSMLDLPYASLVEYTGDKLTIYHPGMRELNAEERAAMDEWKKIACTEDYQKRAQNDAYTDGSSTYYQEKAFFEKRGLGYLMACHTENGLKYEPRENKIRDKAVKGEIYLQYNIITA